MPHQTTRYAIPLGLLLALQGCVVLDIRDGLQQVNASMTDTAGSLDAAVLAMGETNRRLGSIETILTRLAEEELREVSEINAEIVRTRDSLNAAYRAIDGVEARLDSMITLVDGVESGLDRMITVELRNLEDSTTELARINVQLADIDRLLTALNVDVGTTLGDIDENLHAVDIHLLSLRGTMIEVSDAIPLVEFVTDEERDDLARSREVRQRRDAR